MKLTLLFLVLTTLNLSYAESINAYLVKEENAKSYTIEGKEFCIINYEEIESSWFSNEYAYGKTLIPCETFNGLDNLGWKDYVPDHKSAKIMLKGKKLIRTQTKLNLEMSGFVDSVNGEWIMSQYLDSIEHPELGIIFEN